MEHTATPLELLLAGCSARGIPLGAYRREFLSRRLVRAATLAGEVFLDRTVERLLGDPAALERFLAELSVGASAFFRDAVPFAVLEEKILPTLERVPGPVRVWSAGCAHGQEAWSVAMLLAERRGDFEVVGSDRSASFVAAAREGIYDAEELSRVTLGRVQRFFCREGERYRVGDELRARVSFRVQDLAHEPPPADDFHLALCRNVLIYLSPASKGLVFANLARALRPGGHLVLGQAESLPAQVGAFEAVIPYARIFRKEAA